MSVVDTETKMFGVEIRELPKAFKVRLLKQAAARSMPMPDPEEETDDTRVTDGMAGAIGTGD